MKFIIPSQERYYQHHDGGLYVSCMLATMTTDSSKVMIYKHIAPFDQVILVQFLNEFNNGAFKELTVDEFDFLYHKMRQDLNSAQNMIKNNKLKNITEPKILEALIARGALLKVTSVQHHPA
jgi:hypothetical protein